MSKRPLTRRWTPAIQNRVRLKLRETALQAKRSRLAIPNAQTMPDIASIPIGGAKTMDAAILFFDLENFTAITANLKLDQTLELLNYVIPNIMIVVRNWGGFFEKNTGDGVMAILGTESKDLNVIAQDAIECAMAIRYLMTNDIQPALARAGLPIINFRIGIDMGQVLIGKIGINNHNFLSAIGTAANLASKIQSLALSNGICIGNGLARNLHPYLYAFCEVGVHPEWTWRYGNNGPPYNFYHFNHDWPDPAEWIRGGFLRQPVA